MEQPSDGTRVSIFGMTGIVADHTKSGISPKPATSFIDMKDSFYVLLDDKFRDSRYAFNPYYITNKDDIVLIHESLDKKCKDPCPKCNGQCDWVAMALKCNKCGNIVL